MRYENEFKLYQQTKLLADKNIQFPAKLKLKKGRIISIRPIISILVAASVLVLIYLNFTPNNLASKQKIAELNKTITSKKRIENEPIITEVKNNKNTQKSINKIMTKSLDKKSIIFTDGNSIQKTIAFTELTLPTTSPKDSIIQTEITQIEIAKTEKLPNSLFNTIETKNNVYESIVSKTLDHLNELKKMFGMKLSKEQKEDILAESINLHTRISDVNYHAIQKLEKYKQQIISQFNLLIATESKLKFRTPIISQYTPPPLFEFGRKSNRN